MQLKINVFIYFVHFTFLTCAGSGVSLSSSDGLGGLVEGTVEFEVVLGVRGAFSESLHCSTSTSTSSSGNRSTEMGPETEIDILLFTAVKINYILPGEHSLNGQWQVLICNNLVLLLLACQLLPFKIIIKTNAPPTQQRFNCSIVEVLYS